MGLNKRKLKGLIEYSDLRNSEGIYTEDDVIGVSTEKCMIPTKAELDGVNIHNYKIFAPGWFAFVADTSRRGDKMALAYNNTDRTYIVSTWYVVFHICENADTILCSDYLYLYFNRPEFDRYARMNSWGSAREYFWFSDMEDIELELPSLSIQQKYVGIYKSMVANQQAYERGLEDLKLVCDGYIEDLRRKVPCKKIGSYIELVETRNDDLRYGIDDVRGVSIDKKFIDTKADMKDVDLTPYLRSSSIELPCEIDYVKMESGFKHRMKGIRDGIITEPQRRTFSEKQQLDPEAYQLYGLIEKLDDKIDAWKNRTRFIAYLQGDSTISRHSIKGLYLEEFDEELLSTFEECYAAADNSDKRDYASLLLSMTYDFDTYSSKDNIVATRNSFKNLKEWLSLMETNDSITALINRSLIEEIQKSQ